MDRIERVKTEHIRYWADRSLDENNARSYVYKAFSLLYLNRDVDYANGILNDEKIANGSSWEITDQTPFILYWTMPALLRIYFMFNRTGGTKGGTLTEGSEAVIKKVLWEFMLCHIDKVFPPRHNTLRIVKSENHDMLIRTVILLSAQVLAQDEDYQKKTLDGGRTLAELHRHATSFFREYFVTRAKIGAFVEGSDAYRTITLEGMVTLFDFCDDEQVRELSKMMMDIVWIEYCTENICSVRGGAKSRVYNRDTDARSGYLWFARIGNMYFDYHGDNSREFPVTIAASAYTPPPIAYEIVSEREGKRYESVSRIPGAGGTATAFFGEEFAPVYFLSEEESVTKYTYVSPAFIMGSFRQNPDSDLIWLSSQNRWEGVIFKGNPDARLFLYRDTQSPIYDVLQTMQLGSTMISKNLSDENLKLYIYPFDYSKPLTLTEGWLFGEAQSCYYAVKPTEGAIKKENGSLVFTDKNTPVIIHVEEQADFDGIEQFKDYILGNKVLTLGSLVYYKDAKSQGFGIEYKGNGKTCRTIDGEFVDYGQRMMMDSPYMQSEFASGVIHVCAGGKTINYDFKNIKILEGER